jgi:hypothetical protein
MLHAEDPREALLRLARPFLREFHPSGANLLCLSYIRPETTKGGIILSSGENSVRDEDAYQGKVQLIVKMGPQCFEDSTTYHFEPSVLEDNKMRHPRVGDWIMIRVGESLPFRIGELPARLVLDANVRMVLKRPDVIM